MSRKLRVIEGGLLSKEQCPKKFVSAYITDTRLMGSLGMHIHWELEGCHESGHLHQFFLFDVEEFGFDSYEQIYSDDLQQIQVVEHSMIHPLGGRKVKLSQKEAKALATEFVLFNLSRNLPIPAKHEDYSFLLQKDDPLTAQEVETVFAKSCTPIVSEYQLIHYFIMRACAKDDAGANYLSTGNVTIEPFEKFNVTTLCKNTIDEKDGWFISESLVENAKGYHIVISRAKVEDMLVSAFEYQSSFPITATEASFILSRPEFITLYEVAGGPMDPEEDTPEFHYNTVSTIHENGRLFMAFKENNDHVNKRVFLLSEDVFGLYYITDYGQFIVAAYEEKAIKALERDLNRSTFGKYLIPTGKYEFKDPVLYDFIQSGFDDFEDFLELIRGED